MKKAIITILAVLTVIVTTMAPASTMKAEAATADQTMTMNARLLADINNISLEPYPSRWNKWMRYDKFQQMARREPFLYYIWKLRFFRARTEHRSRQRIRKPEGKPFTLQQHGKRQLY